MKAPSNSTKLPSYFSMSVLLLMLITVTIRLCCPYLSRFTYFMTLLLMAAIYIRMWCIKPKIKNSIDYLLFAVTFTGALIIFIIKMINN